MTALNSTIINYMLIFFLNDMKIDVYGVILVSLSGYQYSNKTESTSECKMWRGSINK